MEVSKAEDGRQDEEDLFRLSFKYYKSIQTSDPNKQNRKVKNQTDSNVSTVISDLGINGLLQNEFVSQRSNRVECNCNCHSIFGLKPPDAWKVYDFKFPEGLIFIRNPFTAAGQRYWMKRTIVDFPKKPNISNIDNLERKEGIKIKDKMTDEEFYRKLRWVTFGYHHDWDTKVYSESQKNEFPADLASLTKFISQALRFSHFKAEAAIANYYHLDSTLSGHVDKSEANMTAPLFSLSFGQTAIFLIGGLTKTVKPQAVLLQSGDIVVMSGKSRLSYHGVPKILKSSSDPWNCDLDSDADGGSNSSKRIKLEPFCEFHSNPEATSISSNCVKNLDWNDILSNYASLSRINLNIRQVLFPGQTEIITNSNMIKT